MKISLKSLRENLPKKLKLGTGILNRQDNKFRKSKFTM
jgi:hypothetical protein